ncbi:MAG: hypothetical protein ACRCVU_09460 [Flavobacterium sp.]
MEKDKEAYVFKGYALEEVGFTIEDFVKEYDLPLDPVALLKVRNITELIELLVCTFPQTRTEGCTSQQAFYKFRDAITKNGGSQDIVPSTLLEEVFPKLNRIENVKEVEEELGFKLSILKPKEYKVLLLWLLFFILVIFIFYQQFLLAALGIVVLYFFRGIVFANGEEFRVDTVGEVVEKMSRQNYLDCRRERETINEKEIRSIIIYFFTDKLGLTEEEFLNAKFG